MTPQNDLNLVLILLHAPKGDLNELTLPVR